MKSYNFVASLWDWPIEKINRNLKLICNLDVNQLDARIIVHFI